MGAAAEIELDGEMAFAAAARRVIATRFEEVLEQGDRVLEIDDVEPLHDMRVAIRRLRVALALFRPCLPDPAGREVRRSVKALARALGRRRDVDVMLETLAQVEASAGPTAAGPAEALAAGLRAEQHRANRDLTSAVAAPALDRLAAAIDELTASIGSGPADDHLADRAAVAVRGRTERLIVRSAALEHGGTEDLHKLRLKAKRLRDTLELTGTCFGPEAGRARAAAEELADVLGYIHDRDVLIERVEALPADEARAALDGALIGQRARLLAAARAIWSEAERSGTWRRLEAGAVCVSS